MTPEQQEVHEKGRTYFEQGNLEAAESCFRELVKDNPDRFADVYNKLGFIYHRKGLSEKAMACFKPGERGDLDLQMVSLIAVEAATGCVRDYDAHNIFT